MIESERRRGVVYSHSMSNKKVAERSMTLLHYRFCSPGTSGDFAERLKKDANLALLGISSHYDPRDGSQRRPFFKFLCNAKEANCAER
jgi:hypothetical protein